MARFPWLTFFSVGAGIYWASLGSLGMRAFSSPNVSNKAAAWPGLLTGRGLATLLAIGGDRDWGSICGYPGIDPSPSQRIQLHGAGLAPHEEIVPRAGLRHVRACIIGHRHFKDQGLFTAAGNDSIDSTRIRELSYGRPPNQRVVTYTRGPAGGQGRNIL